MFDVYAVQHRVEKLGAEAGLALATAVAELRPERAPHTREELQSFLLPFAETGWSEAEMLDIARKVPKHWPCDHREIYFDFRLQRWMRILDAPTLEECLEDYVKHAPSEGEALTYLEGKIREFFARHGRPRPSV